MPAKIKNECDNRMLSESEVKLRRKYDVDCFDIIACGNICAYCNTNAERMLKAFTVKVL